MLGNLEWNIARKESRWIHDHFVPLKIADEVEPFYSAFRRLDGRQVVELKRYGPDGRPLAANLGRRSTRCWL